METPHVVSCKARMKHRALWKLSVVTTAEAEDAVSESLAGFFGRAANGHTDFRTCRTTVSVFFETRPAGLGTFRHDWKQTLARIKSCGLVVGSGALRVQKIRRENWAESWKRHFKPIEIGDALLLKPSWIKRQPKRGQAVVVLDPGLSFGTGQHPTTSFCLRELVRRRPLSERWPSRPAARSRKPSRRNHSQAPALPRAATGDRSRSFLDIGTGSGILAIAAVKLGYSPVRAFDFDPESVRVARANAKANRIGGKLTITRGDLTKLPERPARRYDVVCANLISTLLMAERQRIARFVKPGGHLVVAGILKTEFGSVRSAFESLGLRLMARKCEREWASGVLRARRKLAA
ncbi:MAG: 50S ribosomal protein L11 methyltransferase [Pedosphaera sp.]|nr:50S ribosomal protein L11 methyltransferase [Pedosphaera sp.]